MKHRLEIEGTILLIHILCTCTFPFKKMFLQNLLCYVSATLAFRFPGQLQQIPQLGLVLQLRVGLEK